MSSYYFNSDYQRELTRRLQDLIRYAKETFSYYRDLYAGIENINNLSDMNKFPILQRAELLNSSLIDEVMGKNPPFYFETSGTTGNPLPVLPNFEGKNKIFSDFLKEWLSLNEGKINRAVIALPFEMNPVGLKYFYALAGLGITSIPVGVRSHLCLPEKVLSILNRLKPELLIGRPLEMLRYAEADRLKESPSCIPSIKSIKKIIFTGEIVSENKFKRLSKLYGNAKIYGNYGLTELDGGGLTTCSKYGYKYHLPVSPYLFVEVLHDDFITPVLDGEIGNIVITNSDKNYMPLIRYNTGDKGRLHVYCDCGIETPAIEILGRKSDCMLGAKGEIYPIQVENILFKYDCIGSDYQLIQLNHKYFLRIEIDSKQCDSPELLKAELKNEIMIALGLDLEIKVYEFGNLVNKLGIAKDKAGKLHILNHNTMSNSIDNAIANSLDNEIDNALDHSISNLMEDAFPAINICNE